MEYFSCEAARRLPGLRLVLTEGTPGPWSEAAKSVLYARKVDFAPVRQILMADNDDVFAWTGVRNAPVAMYEEEPPRHTWVDILFLAERLGHGPSLLPADRALRVECIGISHEICGEDGLGWNRRLDLFKKRVDNAGGDIDASGLPARAIRDYHATAPAMAVATARLIDILGMLDRRLERQRAAGSEYLVGERLSAADIYFAVFAGMLAPMPADMNPMPDWLRVLYSSGSPDLRQAFTPAMAALQHLIYRRHLKLPMEF